jgi:hypothetical protein
MNKAPALVHPIDHLQNALSPSVDPAPKENRLFTRRDMTPDLLEHLPVLFCSWADDLAVEFHSAALSTLAPSSSGVPSFRTTGIL